MIKTLCKLFGLACIIKIVKEKVGTLTYTFQHNLKVQAKKIAHIFLIGSLVFMLFGLGLRFLLLGLAYWFNTLLSSAYLGFFLVAFFCFLLVIVILVFLRKKINRQAMEQNDISDWK